MITINIAKDFTRTPGPRLIVQGDKSGEQFRKEILEPAYINAKENNSKLLIILDGTFGYYDSFIEESFGGLKREYPSDDIYSFLIIVSDEEPEWIDRIKVMIDEALNKKR